MEVHRFHPVIPLGIPHKLIEDDEYRGECPSVIRGSYHLLIND